MTAYTSMNAFRIKLLRHTTPYGWCSCARACRHTIMCEIPCWSNPRARVANLSASCSLLTHHRMMLDTGKQTARCLTLLCGISPLCRLWWPPASERFYSLIFLPSSIAYSQDWCGTVHSLVSSRHCIATSSRSSHLSDNTFEDSLVGIGKRARDLKLWQSLRAL